MKSLPVKAVAALAAVLAVSNASARGLPLSIELHGCILPAPACPPERDVVTLTVGDGKLSFGVEKLRLLSHVRASTAGVLHEMKMRPVRVHGPDELLHRLTPGAHVRVGAFLRLSQHYMILKSVEPEPEPEGHH